LRINYLKNRLNKSIVNITCITERNKSVVSLLHWICRISW